MARWLVTIGLIAATVTALAVLWPTGDPPAPDSILPSRPISARSAPESSSVSPHHHEDHVHPAPVATDWIKPEDREAIYMELPMTDQDGRPLKLSDLTGRPMAMSFIFTRCPMPDMCPLITLTMANLQRDCEKAGLAENVHLLLVTYDPAYDTPERLYNYGATRGLRFTNAKMLRPDSDVMSDLLYVLDIDIAPSADGTFGHFIELVLFDHKGRCASNTRGTVWNNAKVLEQLKTLVSEQEVSAQR